LQQTLLKQTRKIDFQASLVYVFLLYFVVARSSVVVHTLIPFSRLQKLLATKLSSHQSLTTQIHSLPSRTYVSLLSFYGKKAL